MIFCMSKKSKKLKSYNVNTLNDFSHRTSNSLEWGHENESITMLIHIDIVHTLNDMSYDVREEFRIDNITIHGKLKSDYENQN